MRLSNLSAGMRVPNYRRLCALLEEEVKDGNSKKAQLARWERFFTYKKEGNAFVITEVFSTPKMNTDGRMEYMKYAEQLMLNLLCQYCDENGEEVSMSFAEWSIELGIIPRRIFDDSLEGQYVYPNGYGALAFRRVRFELISKAREIVIAASKRLEKDGAVCAQVQTYITKMLRRAKATDEEQTAIETARKRALEVAEASSVFAARMNQSKGIKYEEELSRIYHEEYGWTSVDVKLEVEVKNMDVVRQYENIDASEASEKLREEIRDVLISKVKANQEASERRAYEHLDYWDDPDVKTPFYMSKFMESDMTRLLEEII